MAKKQYTPPTDKIILGFTGSIGSGCTFIAKEIATRFDFQYYSLSDILKEIAVQKSIPTTVESLQNLGDQIRQDEGDGYLAIKLLFSNNKAMLKAKGIIVDSIRNDAEVAELRQFPYFYLFSIQADEKLRCKRTLAAGKFENEKEFELANERDKAEDFSYGQQVKKCNDLSDIIINNNSNFPSHSVKKKDEFFSALEKYIALISNNKKQSKFPAPDYIPTINETLMTMAYSESQRSLCLKRKVGAIVAFINTTKKTAPIDNSITEYVQIISSGHNEVPLGSVPCVFSDYEKCYRDYLQEEQAKKIKHCPNCGKKVKLPLIKCINCNYTTDEYLRACPRCKYEFEVKYLCTKCNTEIFKKYLTSGGKLLDMCRSLHAEENALLSLAKNSGSNTQNLVLYTTTYPCNLCANKIVMAGIKKVIYADPYPMEEAKTILESGGVTTEQFQGVKSSAFFRLYR